MEKFTWSKKVIALVLLLLFSFMTFVPTSAYATSSSDNSAEVVAQESSSNKSGSTLTKVTAQFLNGIGGTEIINPETYSVSAKEQDPKEIEGWVYTDYDEDVDYVYVPKDVPYIVGYPDSTVRPLRWITRAEATAVFYRLYDGDYPKEIKTYQEGKTFTDVPEDHWAHDTIVQMYESGIITGEGHKFNPDQPITRAELAALATRFNPDKFSSSSDDAPFKDVEDGAWYQDVVLLAAANEWVSGYPDKTFKPENNVTRTETMAVINRVLQRQITAERLNEVGAKNPYTDIKSSDWYYADAIEATITHQTEDWHIIDYNDGAYNVIIEDYVDQDGNVIADQEVSQGKAIESPRDIPGFKYLGYVKHSTYIYEKGVADPSIEKTSNGEGENGIPLFPGDTVTYTVKVTNSDKATRWIENAVVSDTIPEFLTLVDGSVYVDNQSVEYQVEKTGDEKDPTVELIVPVGQVDIGATKTVTFACTIDKDAYNKTIKNVATVTGDNIDPKEDEDEGFTVQEGKAYLTIDKQVSKQEVEVGEKLSYNIIVGTDKTSETKAKNVVVTDVIDENLVFEGNLRVNDKPYDEYTYNEESRKLTVNLKNIGVEKFKSITFDVSVEKDAFNTSIENIAVAKADNADKVTDNAPVVTVKEGTADLSIKKEPAERNVEVGDEFYYKITVGNNSNAQTTAHNVVVHDVIPQEIDFRGQVTLDGANANYNWDPTTRQLDVRVGGLEPGAQAEVIIYGTIGNSAYGAEIENIAQVTADNADPKEDEAKVVTVKDGDPDGSFTNKVPSVTVAHPGDTYDYTITIQNSPSATADWNVEISDPLPDGIKFAGNCEVNGKQTNDYSYDSNTNTLTLKPEPIKPGEKLIWKFNVEVQPGTEGTTINNVAILTDKDTGTEEPIPSTPVDVPALPVDAYISKSANKESVQDLEEFEYTVVVQNDQDSGTWKNVMVTDVLPAEVQLIGDPTINGKAYPDYWRSGNSVYFYLGDMEQGERAEIKYTVMVSKGTQKTVYVDAGQEATEAQIRDNTVTLVNTATARGDNGEGTAEDHNVKVPPIIVENDDPENPPITDPKEVRAEKLSEKQIVDLSKDRNNVYTIKMYNDTEEVWKNVVLTDELYTKRLHLYADTLKLNGVKLEWGSGYVYKEDKVNLKDMLTVNVGDIQPGETAILEFEVRFENDDSDYNYTNEATITSDNQKTLYPEAPTVVFTNPQPESGLHQKLFAGYDDGSWHPSIEDDQDIYYLSVEEAACVISRAATKQYIDDRKGENYDDLNASLPAGFPKNQWYAQNVRFMGVIGALKEEDVIYGDPNVKGTDYLIQDRMIVTREQLGRMLKTIGFTNLPPGKNYQETDPSVRTSRGEFADEICYILNRDKTPDTNGKELNEFTDAVGNGLVTEVSIWHNYVLYGYEGDEIWTCTDKSKGVEL